VDEFPCESALLDVLPIDEREELPVPEPSIMVESEFMVTPICFKCCFSVTDGLSTSSGDEKLAGSVIVLGKMYEIFLLCLTESLSDDEVEASSVGVFSLSPDLDGSNSGVSTGIMSAGTVTCGSWDKRDAIS